MSYCGIKNYSFINWYIGKHENEYAMEFSDWADLGKVVSLGKDVDEQMNRAGIIHFAAPHPSPRNRKFNDPKFEKNLKRRLKRYIDAHP